MDAADVSFVVFGRLEIGASPAAAYRLVSDITRMGEWSPECVGGEWIERVGDRIEPSVGDRFRGRNRAGSREWVTECRVIVAEPPREFSWDVLTLAPAPGTSIWRFLLMEVESGVLLEERFEMSAAPDGLRSTLEHLGPERSRVFLEERQRQLAEGIDLTLRRLKSALEEP